jgi:hypothetical protein
MDLRNIDDEEGKDGLDRLARGVARTISTRGGRDLRSRPLAFAPLARRLAKERRKRRAKYFALVSLGCAVVAVMLGSGAPSRLDGQRDILTYTVNGDPPPHGGYIAPATSAEPVLSFSDGTRVRLAPRARGRVVDLNRHGARIALEEGKANVEVVHRPGAQWFFEAGPFLVTVHGTAFSLGWNAQNGRLEVAMRSGIVSVTGPVSGGEIFLRAGQTLSLSLNDSESADAPTDRPGTDPAALAPVLSGARSSRLRGESDWSARLADGQAAEIVAAANRRGLARVLAFSNSENLAALADAARFERNDGLARRALLAQRRRFPRSDRAAEASFLLGRLDDAAVEGSARALDWYDRYLREAPDGAYASEALGRKMRVLERSGRQVEATEIARDYLQRFPGGTYAHAAQALVHAL